MTGGHKKGCRKTQVLLYFVLAKMVALLITLLMVALKKKNCYIMILAK